MQVGKKSCQKVRARVLIREPASSYNKILLVGRAAFVNPETPSVGKGQVNKVTGGGGLTKKLGESACHVNLTELHLTMA
jgi:hypothetical protein